MAEPSASVYQGASATSSSTVEASEAIQSSILTQAPSPQPVPTISPLDVHELHKQKAGTDFDSGSQSDSGETSPIIPGNALMTLNLRGKPITISRDELVGLPDSVLLCLFPNGLTYGDLAMFPTVAPNETPESPSESLYIDVS